MSFDSAAIFGNNRSKRYALLVENGKVKEAFVEPDNIGLNGRDVSLQCRSLSLTRVSLRRREGARLDQMRLQGSGNILQVDYGTDIPGHIGPVEDLVGTVSDTWSKWYTSSSIYYPLHTKYSYIQKR